MTHMEMVEKLRKSANVTFEEARDALEKANWDLLDAMIELERQGKIKPGARYDTGSEEQETRTVYINKESGWDRFWKSFKDVCRKLCKNDLQATQGGTQILRLPIIVAILLLCVSFYVLLPLMLVSLFFGWRYSFCGPDFTNSKVNEAMGKATDAAEDIKRTLTEEEKK